MLMGGLGHRGELIPTLGWFERFSEKVSGQPAWASLPCGLAIISLITALFGLYWDVSLHIDRGRDPGVFSNPSHWFILGGLYGIFAAGFFAICLGREERADRPGPTAVRIGKDWYAPLGGIMMMVCGLLLAHRLPARRLLASPLRPGRHALGPDAPHAHRRRGHDAAGDRDHPGRGRAGDEDRRRDAQGAGLGAPPARRLAAGRPARRHVDVPGRVRLGRPAVPDDLPPDADHARRRPDARHGADLDRARRRCSARSAFFLIARFLLDVVIVHNALGESLAHFPLYIVEALCVEAAALIVVHAAPARLRPHRRRADRHRRPGRRMGLVARLDAAALVGRDPARDDRARPRDGARRVGARRLDRRAPVGGRPAVLRDQAPALARRRCGASRSS